MQKRLIGIATLAAGVLALASAAVATAAIPLPSSIAPSSSKTIIAKGQCTGTSTSLLKVTTDGTKVQVAFQVTENQLTLSPSQNRYWSATLVRNGSLIYSGVASTQPTGSFTVARSFAASPSATPTKIVGSAKTLDSRESCVATITF